MVIRKADAKYLRKNRLEWRNKMTHISLWCDGKEVGSVSPAWDIGKQLNWEYGIYSGEAASVGEAVEKVYEQHDLAVRGF